VAGVAVPGRAMPTQHQAGPSGTSARLGRPGLGHRRVPDALAWSSPDGGEVVAYLPSPGPGWAVYRSGGYTRLHVTSVPDPHYVAW
jgi:hypothetical protein